MYYCVIYVLASWIPLADTCRRFNLSLWMQYGFHYIIYYPRQVAKIQLINKLVQMLKPFFGKINAVLVLARLMDIHLIPASFVQALAFVTSPVLSKSAKQKKINRYNRNNRIGMFDLNEIENTEIDTLTTNLYNEFEGIYYKFHTFRLINRYAKFGSMHVGRYEFVIEGKNTQNKDEEWKSYQFHFKPSTKYQIPSVVPLHIPRLDWRTWFLPLYWKRYMQHGGCM